MEVCDQFHARAALRPVGKGWIVSRVSLEASEARKYTLPHLGIELRCLGRAARSLVTVPTELFLLQTRQSYISHSSSVLPSACDELLYHCSYCNCWTIQLAGLFPAFVL